YASAELSAYIDYAVVAWASDRCRKAVESNESDDGAPWSRDALQQIRMAYQGYEKLLSDMTAVVPSLEDHHQQQQVIQPPPSSSSLQPRNYNNEAQSTGSHSRLSSQFQDRHGNSHDATQLDVVSSSSSPTRPTNQPQPSQGFVSINGTSKRQGHESRERDGRTGEMIRDEGLTLMMQQQQQQQKQQKQQPQRKSYAAGSPSGSSSRDHHHRPKGTQRQDHAAAYYDNNNNTNNSTPSQQQRHHRPAVGVSSSAQRLPSSFKKGTQTAFHPSAGRPNYAKDRHNPGRSSNQAVKVNLKPQPPPTPSWMDGPVATSGNRR
ncbi:unnamed protein product, partial [Fusarium langsethiae]